MKKELSPPEETISGIKNVWETQNHIEEENPIPTSVDVVNHIASFFAPGEFYYYILNFNTLQMEHVHENFTNILGYQTKGFEVNSILNALHPEDLGTMAEKEAAVAEFLFNYLPTAEILDYKTSYIMRLKHKDGEYKSILHQSKAINLSSDGKIHQVMAVHTDITHLNPAIDQKVTFIGINKPNYYCYDASKKTFTKEIAQMKFTDKETKVIQLISEGKNYNDISSELGVTKETIKSHKKNIYSKAGVNNAAQLISICIRQGVI